MIFKALSSRSRILLFILIFFFALGLVNFSNLTLTETRAGNRLRVECVRRNASENESLLQQLPSCRDFNGKLTGTYNGAVFVPNECRYKIFTSREINDALAGKRIGVIGASYQRNLFRCMADILSNGYSAQSDTRWPHSFRQGPNWRAVASCANIHVGGGDDGRYIDALSGAQIDFFWNPLTWQKHAKNATVCPFEACVENLLAPALNSTSLQLAAQYPLCVPVEGKVTNCLDARQMRYFGWRTRWTLLPKLLESASPPYDALVVGDRSTPEAEFARLRPFYKRQPTFVSEPKMSPDWDKAIWKLHVAQDHNYYMETAAINMARADLASTKLHLQGDALVTEARIVYDRLIHVLNPDAYATMGRSLADVLASGEQHTINDHWNFGERNYFGKGKMTGDLYFQSLLARYQAHLRGEIL